jgi:hypothetical protein
VSGLGDTMQRFWGEIAARPDGCLDLQPFTASLLDLLLSFVPYLLLRSPIERAARWRMRRGAEGGR